MLDFNQRPSDPKSDALKRAELMPEISYIYLYIKPFDLFKHYQYKFHHFRNHIMIRHYRHS